MNHPLPDFFSSTPRGVSTALILLAIGLALDALIAASLGTPV
ncbi:MAG TPA: hypothetical protein PK620_15580 [Denitromonas sp.]|nr:hypothetical protein [Denitromonas sp.]HQV16332.1 hypothetical protein [Denitromonas sp.]